MVRGFRKLILLSKANANQNPYLIVTPTQFDFDNNGGTKTMTIQSNVEWKITIN